VRFAKFLSGEFITGIVVNPPDRKLAKRTSVQWSRIYFEIERAPSEILANLPGQSSPTGQIFLHWAAATRSISK